MKLDANHNEIRNLEIFKNPETLQYLQFLDLSFNRIKSLTEMNTNSLTLLNLENNIIDNAVEFKGLHQIKILKLNQNKLKNCHGLSNMPELEVLYLNENRLITLDGLYNLPKLRKLRVNINKVL